MDIGKSQWVYILPQKDAPQELYDLSQDIGEKNNLLKGIYGAAAIPAEHPHANLVRKMIKAFQQCNNVKDPRSMPIRNISATPAVE